MDGATKIASPVAVESVIGALRVRHNAIIVLPERAARRQALLYIVTVVFRDGDDRRVARPTV